MNLQPAARPNWRFTRLDDESEPSLPEVHASIAVPHSATGLKRLLAFVGPGYMVAVGYMDPGNWATDLAGDQSYNAI